MIFTRINSVCAIALLFNLASNYAQSGTEETLVTANRTKETSFESLSAITIITKRNIEKKQFNDVTDVLATATGIDPVRTGGIGSNASVFTRDTGLSQSLVLTMGNGFHLYL